MLLSTPLDRSRLGELDPFLEAMRTSLRYERAAWQRRNRITRFAVWVVDADETAQVVVLVDGEQPAEALHRLAGESGSFEEWLRGWLGWMAPGTLEAWVDQACEARFDSAIGAGAWKELPR